MRVRKLEQNRGWAMAVAAGILKPTLLAATSRTWIDGEKIPATGGCVVAVYAPPMPEPDFIWRFRIARQQQDAVRLLTSLGATAV